MLQGASSKVSAEHAAVVHDPTVRIDGLETNLGLPVSQHQPLMNKFKMLFIPIMAVDANGNTCPGTQPITYTKQVR